MNETLLLVWAAIAIIGIISIIIVKIYYKDKEEEEYKLDDITTRNPIHEMVSDNTKSPPVKEDPTKQRTNPISNYFSNEEEPSITLRKEDTKPEKEFNPYIVPETSEAIPNRNISYSSQNQVLVNYDDNVKKFQEPITETQRDIMSQNKKNETSDVAFNQDSESKHELKDLFTIDELIKESKRKDDEREKESKTIRKETEDNSDIKESIKKNREAKESENQDITDIKSSIEKMHEIAESIKASGSTNIEQSSASQKDITEAINTATNESEKEEVPEISETKSITDAVIKKESEPKEETVQKTLTVEETVQDTLTDDGKEKTETITESIKESEEITEPSLKTPNKIEEDSVSILSGADEDYEFGASIDSSNLFEDENGELSDLDYRKDLAKFTNTIKNSSIIKDIRDKIISEPEPEEDVNEEFIRNVNSYTEEAYEYYDDYAPIINETHVDYVEPTEEEQLRQENTRRVFENAKNNAAEEITPVKEEGIPPIKEIPEKSSLKVLINNNEEVLRKGDEIIFNHKGESYSSKVYSIKGDNIEVKYRRQNITIKPEDIKKIY